MGIRVKLEHRTEYLYDRRVNLAPQTLRLRPAPHCRTDIVSYGLRVEPASHFLNWQQDPQGNYNARLVFQQPAQALKIFVEVIADLAPINPFDFFVEDYAEQFPFEYASLDRQELLPFLARPILGPRLEAYLKELDCTPRRTIDFLVEINRQLHEHIRYVIRLEPGVQSAEETLQLRAGSCRDSAWLLMQVLRAKGFAARFVSGYLIQLTPDVPPLDGPAGPKEDFADLHAWTEVFLPGAGWVGLDPTSGLLTAEGHLPLAATPNPETAAPITGALEPCEVEFDFSLTVKRIDEPPRVTKPYSEEEWARIDQVGQLVDERLQAGDVRLTMGGEPTFVSIDDMEGAEWTVAAVGPTKQFRSLQLIKRLRERFAPGGLLHFGQGKWYPGESLPRWAYTCLWRKDGDPVWRDPQWLAAPQSPQHADVDTAGAFLATLTDRLQVDARWIQPAYEDPFHTIEHEHRLPVDWDPSELELDEDEDRRRVALALERGLTRPVGLVLPLTRAWWQARAGWMSGPWPFRGERLLLIPGDSPVGLRLPLGSLPRSGVDRLLPYPADPFLAPPPLPSWEELRDRWRASGSRRNVADRSQIIGQTRPHAEDDGLAAMRSADVALMTLRKTRPASSLPPSDLVPINVISTALCIEPRGGQLHVFMPPLGTLEDYLELVAHIEETAAELEQPVVLEGYLPPPDSRLQVLKVTPDPGVIEVNVQPAADWEELKSITLGVYEEAHLNRLGTEKFQRDGRHSGTGGGNHIVLGGPTPQDSPFLRKPDLLKSLITYWNNHPALSYLFSGLFIGPTSQAPRVDEGRRDALYELELAFHALTQVGTPAPWLVDRTLRHLLVDQTGNTHRAEFCIDKLFSPDHANGRLGLVEMRAFEMPPHAWMSLTQQLLVRGLVVLFWENPYPAGLQRWGTAIHDQFMLPDFLWKDLGHVVQDLRTGGIPMEWHWFRPHLEFRCPVLGNVTQEGIELELRLAIEPWYVLGEEPAQGGTARYVDSSVERLQVCVRNFRPETHLILCNGLPVPLVATEELGTYVGGVRYRAWKPPSCLHPNLPVDSPLNFEVVRRNDGCCMGGCQYSVEHPGGLNPTQFPVNALEAECRRRARLVPFHRPLQPNVSSPLQYQNMSNLRLGSVEYPRTLDLRYTPRSRN